MTFKENNITLLQSITIFIKTITIYMKFHKKIKIFCLVLAALLFGARELIHPFFHGHVFATCCHSCFDAGSDEDCSLKGAEAGKHGDLSHEHICPFCNHPAGKYADVTTAIEFVGNSDFLDYSHFYIDVFFNSYREALSRGPPSS